jgi:hypothetical protein
VKSALQGVRVESDSAAAHDRSHNSMPPPVQDQFDEEQDDEFDTAGPDPDDPELPDASDLDDGDDAETIPCPYCRKPVYEEGEWCPSCGNYLSSEDAPRSYPWWLWAGVILSLIGVLVWFF